MKVLLASDGSPSAKHAEELVATTRWPEGTEIEVLCVDQFREGEIELSPDRFDTAHAAVRQGIDERLGALLAQLSGPGRIVRARIVFGRPASAIVYEAEQLRSEVVIVGSHNHGLLASFALGSVSAEVADRAPCPVLVARRSSLGPIVLGHDGSEGARHAEALVAAWPFLARECVRVVSASRLLPPWYAMAGGSPSIDGERLQRMLDAEHAESQRFATEAVARLTAGGVIASAKVSVGMPVDGLLDAIAETNAQLVVVGSRGNTGLARVFLGSVARSILYRAPCSVLIVREQKPVEQHWRAMGRAGVAV